MAGVDEVGWNPGTGTDAPPASISTGGFDWSTFLGSMAQDAGRALSGAISQRIAGSNQQRAPTGQVYNEGQAGAVTIKPVSISPQMLLIAGGLLLVFVLVKD